MPIKYVKTVVAVRALIKSILFEVLFSSRVSRVRDLVVVSNMFCWSSKEWPGTVGLWKGWRVAYATEFAQCLKEGG